MKGKTLIHRFVFTFLLFSTTLVLAQDKGMINGKVVDAETGDPLPGVNIVVEGTNRGSATDLEGVYRIPNMPAGTYNLVATYIGYSQMKIEHVKVIPSAVKEIDFAMSMEVLEGQEVVVTAEALENTEAALLKERQKSNSISDAISAEAISRSGSGDAAEAMKQVTGASVVDGKYVYIRGLGERYSSTHLNGAELPSADPDKNAFQMDLFPSNMLENIVTVKTFTPDKPGNFSGGVVDIGTKSFPEYFTLSLSASAAYNTYSTFNDGFLGYKRGNSDWYAKDDGIRAIPGILADPDVEVPNSTLARLKANRGEVEMADFVDQTSKSFNNIMGPVAETGPLNQSYNFSIGNQTSFLGRPFGYLAGVSYSRSASFYEDGFTGRYTLGDKNAEGLNPQMLLNDSEGKIETNIGGLFNLGYKLTPNHKVLFNTVYSRSGLNKARYQIGAWPKEFTLNDSTTFFENRVLQYIERELYSFQLSGEHLFKPLFNSTIKWSASTTTNTQEEPDLRFFANIKKVEPDGVSYSARNSGFRDPARYFRDMTESNQYFSLDYSLPFKQWNGLSSKFKFGGTWNHKERDFNERIFTISPTMLYEGDPYAYFGEDKMGVVDIDTLNNDRYGYTFGNVVADRSKAQNNYEGKMDIAAGYFMVELPFTPLLKFVGGARYETTDLSTVSEDTTKKNGKVDVKDWLPSLNLVYMLGENMNVRTAFTRTLARPTFREIAPFESFEFIQGNYFIGNPDLKRTLIDNYDIRWEWFMRPGEIIAVSTFYKVLKNPIERAIIGGTNGQIQYQNVDQAIVYGLEFEVRKNLDIFSPLLSNFHGGANFSYAYSEIDIAETELEVRQAVDPSASGTRELQGQSPYLVNLSFGYENLKSDLAMSLYLNVFGKRLSNVSIGGTPDVYERARGELDFIASKGILKNLSLKVSAKNLLNSKYKESYEFKDKEFIYQEYQYGRSFSIGLNYSR
ncbi:outer membrane beta-barrel protein [candidate division KSB1 bacterium]|nr:outer membrane beta-barrel protein [candidate division KSB1 bacterium]